MSIVIVNWTGGENDPFTYGSNRYKQEFEALGRKVRIINLNEQLIPELLKEHETGIDFAMTWQGLGSRLKSTTSQLPSIWDDLQIPLLCYHGDHPSVMPANHEATSSWVRHIYFTQSFASFANSYFPRRAPAIFIQAPTVYPKQESSETAGDYFVLPKNIDDNLKVYESWKNAPQKNLVNFLGTADSEIAAEFRNGNRRNLHEVIDELLTTQELEKIQQELKGELPANIRIVVHNLLHKVYRNMVAEYTLLELSDMPIKIYGRGWDRFKALGNPKHEFLEGVVTADSSFQYSSNYGILDIGAVNDALHDRTLRAIGNRSSFLMGSAWPHNSLLDQNFSDLFFDGAPGNLYSKAQWIMSAPESHREKCRYFADLYKEKFSVLDFMNQLSEVASGVRNGQ